MKRIEKRYDRMTHLSNSLDWNQVILTIWTVVLLPVITYIGNELKQYAEARKIDNYNEILQKSVMSVVKDVYETEVKNIKGTDAWTDEQKEKARSIAKNKIIFALPASAYNCLKSENPDFNEYVYSLIEASLFDLKNKHEVM
ncbi:MAG: hypothetical protein MR029_02020 [Clostridium sp.]|nr:hypothetical protein [Clostridium sp.]